MIKHITTTTNIDPQRLLLAGFPLSRTVSRALSVLGYVARRFDASTGFLAYRGGAS
jgi:hypothetical protein